MKKLVKGLLFSSLLAIGADGALVANPLTAKADYNNYYGYTEVGNSVVKVRDTGARIYNAYGQSTGRFLPMGSEWKTNLENTLSDGSYYCIGVNEFVKSSDVEYTVDSGLKNNYGTESAGNYDGVAVTTLDGAAVYDAAGQPIGRTLPDGSLWKIDQINNIANGTYYRVGSDEYVSAIDVRVYENTVVFPISRVITTRAGQPAQLYNDNNQPITDRALGPNTKWYTDEYCLIGGSGYFRVATDEYVSMVDVV
ncbi:hypothetical protein D1B17_00905 [Companilactobacillus zhachilii]|uniref:S-layer protein C-terminal domain-containing protein n=1 Tax=Companilactobacillus zhachilii TaxID=2304606 RepID=A0A386PRH2_9LACO|nr:SLAP domain-containing protein [Companilactobacillus zhachilii]AYE37293.1 hypothetical protein D1B17_00905 [Companilactobacillus zhachilii]